ncbi:DUF2922 domain-containing protein [Enterococcus sp. AZ109]|uniref:DUF2922 domain-containing protein n=1 Tax=Enterococcus sp. AZ109 TaxID=2774634 RepID=UPI003F226886
MIKLVSTFRNSEGKKHNLTVKDPDIEKNPDEIKESLELLTQLTIFEKDGVGLFEEVVSAKFVETIETPIFNQEDFLSDPNQPVVFKQSVLALHSKVLEKDASEEKILDPTSFEHSMQPTSTYSELPELPTVTLDLPVQKEPEAVQLDDANLAIKAPPPNFLKELFRRKKNRRRRQQSPPD